MEQIKNDILDRQRINKLPSIGRSHAKGGHDAQIISSSIIRKSGKEFEYLSREVEVCIVQN